MPRFSVSDHCDGERFTNLHAPAGRSVADLVRWARTRERTAWPASIAPSSPQPPPPSHVDPGQVAVTFIGHSTFLIRTASLVMITDPVFTTHAGPFGRLGPARVRPPAIALRDLPRVDLVLLSHNHYDHLQPASLRALRGAPVVTTLGVGRYVEGERTTELDWWEDTRIGGAIVTAVPAQHFSARTPWDKNTSLWCGFVVEIDGVTIYFAGDTGYTPQFAEIGRRFPGVDVALIPIGAYEPRWFMQPMHMNPDEAVRAHVDIRPRSSVGMHFGTFQLTDEGIDEPIRALERARVAHGVAPDAFRVLDFGATLIAGGSGDQEKLS